MSRIAVGGFQHETNSFVTPDTDYAYFTSHRDRPPLVRGAEVVRALSKTSFALSGFLDAIGDRHADRAAPVDERRRRRHGHGGCLRAHRGRARPPPVGGHAGRRRLSRPPRRHGDAILRGWRRRAAAARSGGSRCACADCDQPRLPRERHARDGRARGQHRRLSHLSPCRPGRDRRLRGEGSLAPPRTRPSGGARAAQAALPHSAERSMHARRAVEERCCPHRRGRGRSRRSLLSCGLPALRPPLVRTGRGRPRLRPGERRRRRRCACP